MTDGVVGRPQPRAEDGRLVTGRGSFVGDVRLPRMLHATFVRSYVAHARIERIELDEAVALDGVATVFVAEDLPEVHLSSGRHPLLGVTPQAPLARHKVRFVGEAVAIVLATDRYRAEDAAELVNVEYDEREPDAALLTTSPTTSFSASRSTSGTSNAPSSPRTASCRSGSTRRGRTRLRWSRGAAWPTSTRSPNG